MPWEAQWLSSTWSHHKVLRKLATHFWSFSPASPIDTDPSWLREDRRVAPKLQGSREVYLLISTWNIPFSKHWAYPGLSLFFFHLGPGALFSSYFNYKCQLVTHHRTFLMQFSLTYGKETETKICGKVCNICLWIAKTTTWVSAFLWQASRVWERPFEAGLLPSNHSSCLFPCPFPSSFPLPPLSALLSSSFHSNSDISCRWNAIYWELAVFEISHYILSFI